MNESIITLIEIAIKLAKYNEHNDVISFLKIQSDEFKTILSEEEIQKLMIYANCLNGIERENIENTIWLAEY
ncbi:hypothetical protein ACHRV1_25995 [Flavobacterium aquidurense]|uniref:hypothetical protein n=1 Tax=Flavobacterium aquidurense TaxID=362413 RepID=UPI003757D897